MTDDKKKNGERGGNGKPLSKTGPKAQECQTAKSHERKKYEKHSRTKLQTLQNTKTNTTTREDHT